MAKVDLLHCAGEISGDAAGKRVPCPGRIVNVFERIRATAEELVVLAKEQSAVLAFLYGNMRRSHLLNATAGLDQTCFLRHFARFAIIQDQEINTPKERIEICPGCLDP